MDDVTVMSLVLYPHIHRLIHIYTQVSIAGDDETSLCTTTIQCQNLMRAGCDRSAISLREHSNRALFRHAPMVIEREAPFTQKFAHFVTPRFFY
jgi:hypothetical protein